ncbi:MAG: YabP/YqfC family sporulation protein [Clostridia bacterium]|nr:YabP/YqfC family sporulation protein [Clostridia bacterium]
MQDMRGGSAPLEIGIRKGHRGASLTVGGVVGVYELTDDAISLGTLSGRITLRGSGLLVSVYSGKTVEIRGRIEEVELSYASK